MSEEIAAKKMAMASYLGSLEEVRELLAGGAPVDAVDESGCTALMRSVGGAQLAVLDLLLESGANPNLHCAGDREERQRTFAEWQELARQKPVGFRAETPLISCAALPEHLSISVLERLLAAGADPNISDVTGKCPLHEAAWRGHPEVVEVLLKGRADINARDIFGYTPLMEVYRDYDNPRFREVARILREAGADEAGCENCELEWAAYRPSFDGIRAALERGANVNFVNDRGDTVLRSAVNSRYGHKDEALEIIKFLLAQGADPNLHHPGRGMPPIFPAIEHGDVEVVRLLLSHGADPRIEWRGTTAMRHARAHRRVEIQKLLIAAGAPAPDLRKERGLRQREGNFTAVLVHKGIDEVGAALSEVGEVETAIQGRSVECGDRALLVYQLRGHVWTVVESVTREAVSASRAEELSRALGCEGIFLGVSDALEMVEYTLYDSGARVEHFYSGPRRGATAMETAMAEEWDWEFTTERKKRSPARHVNPREIVHQLLKQEKAFYSGPSSRGGGGTLTVFEGPVSRTMVRADLLRLTGVSKA